MIRKPDNPSVLKSGDLTAFRNIVIENPARISVKHNQLIIETDRAHYVKSMKIFKQNNLQFFRNFSIEETHLLRIFAKKVAGKPCFPALFDGSIIPYQEPSGNYNLMDELAEAVKNYTIPRTIGELQLISLA